MHNVWIPQENRLKNSEICLRKAREKVKNVFCWPKQLEKLEFMKKFCLPSDTHYIIKYSDFFVCF